MDLGAAFSKISGQKAAIDLKILNRPRRIEGLSSLKSRHSKVLEIHDAEANVPVNPLRQVRNWSGRSRDFRVQEVLDPPESEAEAPKPSTEMKKLKRVHPEDDSLPSSDQGSEA